MLLVADNYSTVHVAVNFGEYTVQIYKCFAKILKVHFLESKQF